MTLATSLAIGGTTGFEGTRLHATNPAEGSAALRDLPTVVTNPRLHPVAASECAVIDTGDVNLYADRELHAGVIDTSDDPTGAAFAWPFVMLLVYLGLAVGFVLAR